MKSGPLSPTGSAVYFAGYGGKLWFTEDHGQTYTVATPAVDDAVLDAIELLVPHPYTPSVIQVVTSSVCCYQPLSSCVPPTYCRHDARIHAFSLSRSRMLAIFKLTVCDIITSYWLQRHRTTRCPGMRWTTTLLSKNTTAPP
jgi:short-subunit dehydrogenase involved in D-alanine esterification of teichoic acids